MTQDNHPGEGLTVGEAASRLGVTPHAVRYYERAGLVAIPRDASGHRVITPRAMSRLTFVVRMRSSGMGIGTLTHYVHLVDAGDVTIPERATLMLRHREGILTQLRTLEDALATTDHKIATYGGRLGDPSEPTHHHGGDSA